MKILDKVWMLVNKNDGNVIYCVSDSAKNVWNRVIEEEVMGTGVTKEQLRKRGFRAKKVLICDPD